MMTIQYPTTHCAIHYFRLGCTHPAASETVSSNSFTDAIGNESVPVSNHNAFRVLFDKIAYVYLFEKYAYILSLEMASAGNQHCDNVLGYWHTLVPYS